MPEIPTLQNQVSLQAAPNVQQRPLQNTFGQSIAQGASDVGQAVFRVQQEERAKAARAEFMDADRQVDTVANDLLTEAQKLQGKDAIGSSPVLLKKFDELSSQTGATLQSKRSQAAFQESVNQRRSSLQRQLDGHEGGQREAYYAKSREDYIDQAHINAVSNYQDPKVVDAEIDKIRATIDQKPGMDAAQKATELGVRRSGVYTGVVGRYLANDQIGAAEKYYKSIKDNVNGDKASYIENAINDAKRVAEARARARVDHAEAIAERTLNTIDRQIASGVPAKPEMWAAWESKVRGTSFEDEFKDRVSTEGEIQDTLRKPIGEQLRLVQERQAKLEQGGSVAEAANVQRLTNAVKQNIAQISNAPLLYGEQRLGATNDPVDITQLVDPEQQVAAAATFQDRAARIVGMRKQFGFAVPMRPLLPQESAQLGQALDAASPQQAAAIFAGLRNATGSTDVFKGAMQQIAPDHPVTALAGLRASDQRELVTQSHWFKPDDSITSLNVAATMLRGDRLLNPGKGEKADDGKPKTARLLLPQEAQVDLQSKFADEIGTAFAGRSELADRAYQAVQAYYVGRADETGKLAGDSKTVNTALVKEAVKATLGNVVDYNGNGEVLPPWGMTEHDFEDRVEQKFAATAKAYNLPSDITVNQGSFGLRNASGDGVYSVTLGQKLLLDGQGNPVLLDLRPRDPRDQRGTIQR